MEYTKEMKKDNGRREKFILINRIKGKKVFNKTTLVQSVFKCCSPVTREVLHKNANDTLSM